MKVELAYGREGCTVDLPDRNVDVIEPRETRPKVIRALRILANKVDTMPRKKHGNIPL